MKDANVKDDEGATSSTLLERAKACDQQAWDRLVYLYAPLVYRWCQAKGLQETDAEDCGQLVFIAVAKSLPDFRHDQEGHTFRGWLRTITVNKVTDFLRQDSPDKHGFGGSDAQAAFLNQPAQECVSDEAEDSEEKRILLRRAVELLLADFEESSRQAFWRVVVEGRSVDDVAKEVGISKNAVYIAKSRILSRLRAEFHPLLEMRAALPGGAVP